MPREPKISRTPSRPATSLEELMAASNYGRDPDGEFRSTPRESSPERVMAVGIEFYRACQAEDDAKYLLYDLLREELDVLGKSRSVLETPVTRAQDAFVEQRHTRSGA
jgi:hypothetical protein